MVARVTVSQSFKSPNETCLCRSILEAHQPLSEEDGLSHEEIVELIRAARQQAARAANTELIELYWRMRQFFVAYRDDPKLSPLVRLLPWTHNLIVLGQSKRPEEREFYLRMAVQEHWSKRELERQFRLAAFERAVLHPPRL